MSDFLVSAIKASHYSYSELSKMSGQSVSAISKWVTKGVSPSAQSAINVLHVLGLSEQFDVKERMKEVRGDCTLFVIEQASGIPVSTLEGYLYMKVMPSYRNYLDYMETMERLNKTP